MADGILLGPPFWRSLPKLDPERQPAWHIPDNPDGKDQIIAIRDGLVVLIGLLLGFTLTWRCRGISIAAHCASTKSSRSIRPGFAWTHCRNRTCNAAPRIPTEVDGACCTRAILHTFRVGAPGASGGPRAAEPGGAARTETASRKLPSQIRARPILVQRTVTSASCCSAHTS